MAKYVVIQYFYDMNDNNYVYRAGDEYPRRGYTPSEERIAELANANNRRGVAVIKKITPKKKKPAKAVEENVD